MKKTIVTMVAFSLLGCATAPPGTPGAGSGDTYTPFIDMQGLDSARYANDLAGCRSYAQQIKPNKEAMAGMIGGMFIGALIGGAIAGRSGAESAALAGGGAGVGAAGGRAVLKQETVIANCMAGRGYRVLEGATIPANASIPSPYTNASWPMGAPVLPMSAQSVAQAVGQDAQAAERLATQQTCTDKPLANRTETGPGYDIYSIACSGGGVLKVRCGSGICRVATPQ